MIFRLRLMSHQHNTSTQHSHNHAAHDHNHIPNNKKVLLLSFLLISVFMCIEFIGGYLTRSLALISDAGHMLSDAVALGIALIAVYIRKKIATERKSFGYQRFEMGYASAIATVLFLAMIICNKIIQAALNRVGH